MSWSPLQGRKEPFELGKIWTADTLVTNKITWTHEVVYTSQGQPAVYDMSIALFINSYLTVLGEECLTTVQLLCWHTEQFCNRKELFTENGRGGGAV